MTGRIDGACVVVELGPGGMAHVPAHSLVAFGWESELHVLFKQDLVASTIQSEQFQIPFLRVIDSWIAATPENSVGNPSPPLPLDFISVSISIIYRCKTSPN